MLTPRATTPSPSTSRTQLVLNVSLTVLFPDAISETVLLSMVFNAVLLGSKVPQLLKLRDIGKQMTALTAELERKTAALKSVEERRGSMVEERRGSTSTTSTIDESELT